MGDDILNTAHIHVEQVVFRIHVNDTDCFNCFDMTHGEDKPSYVLYISRSDDTDRKTALICSVCTDEYNLEEIAQWIKKHET